MSKKNTAALKTEVSTNIKTGGNPSITKAVNVRELIRDFIDSTINIVDGGLVIDSRIGYSTPITPASNYEFATKKYVDDNSGTTYIGTTDRITVAGTVIDIASTYAGQASITTLGTISAGEWKGTVISDSYISSASVWNAKAPTASPTFTGVPAAPTASTGTNTTQIATTAFVSASLIAAGVAVPTNRIPFGDAFNVLTTDVNLKYIPGGTNLDITASNTPINTFTDSGVNISMGSSNRAVRGSIGATHLNCLLVWPDNASSVYVRVDNVTANVAFKNGLYLGDALTEPTAYVHMSAGSTTVTPMRFTSGPLNTGAAILAGNVEFLTDKWYGTISTGPAQKEFTTNDAALTSGRIPTATTNGRLTDSTQYTTGVTAAAYVAVGGSPISTSDTFGGYTLAQMAAIIKGLNFAV